jgi:transposase-like protein
MRRASSRKNHSAAHKAKVAIEAAKGVRTVAELAQAYSVHPSQIAVWKKHLLGHVSELFERGAVNKAAHEEEKLKGKLYQEVGRLQVELAWLKKKSRSFS